MIIMIWGCNFGISLTNCKRINLSLMKNSFYLILLVISLLFQFSCTEESVTDEFQDANGNVEEKLIRSVSYVSPEHPEDNITVNFSYNNDGSLNTVSDGTDTSIFLYEDNELNTITGSNDNLTMEELYQSPYDAFEIGQVVSYDENGNPEIIEFLRRNMILILAIISQKFTRPFLIMMMLRTLLLYHQSSRFYRCA